MRGVRRRLTVFVLLLLAAEWWPFGGL